MSLDLSTVRTKFDWAKGHTDKFKAEIDVWGHGQGESPPFRIEKKFDRETSCFMYRLVNVQTPPVLLSLIVGDSLNNLQGTLDYIAWELVQAGADPKPKHPEHITFPLWTDPKFWTVKSIVKKLPGIRPDHLAVVQKYQPYQCGREVLGKLSDLNRKNKHRRIELVLARHHEFEFGNFSPTNFTIKRIWVSPPFHPILESGTELMRICGDLTGDGEPEMIMDFKGSSSIAFADGAWVEPMLDRIVEQITSTLVDFESIP